MALFLLAHRADGSLLLLPLILNRTFASETLDGRDGPITSAMSIYAAVVDESDTYIEGPFNNPNGQAHSRAPVAVAPAQYTGILTEDSTTANREPLPPRRSRPPAAPPVTAQRPPPPIYRSMAEAPAPALGPFNPREMHPAERVIVEEDWYYRNVTRQDVEVMLQDVRLRWQCARPFPDCAHAVCCLMRVKSIAHCALCAAATLGSCYV
ncbi:uncharacterized protein MONBRDRAFT_8798 [Monosiga brevicollis MX1]|uniref:SWIM-type domain-containing protein n=1 Tax=Monosiga brevicollis TaxID=81824 RepID=A9V157_MONBE|nr:uncharacterized protein MONBRDRAFT_8798 [Monosiga brevicollis MX1]EDQ88750.1 predicted protein [Monosiga brevicollis MX1]|eukprot:XP_001746363.1 hypothetical protein [Monosiga brevicollis MX1]